MRGCISAATSTTDLSKPKKTKVFSKLKNKKDDKHSTGVVAPTTVVGIRSKHKSKSRSSTDAGVGGSSVGSSSTISAPTQPSRPIFGVSLADALRNSPSHDGVPVPAIFRMCIDYVTEKGIRVEGIYRLSPTKNQLDEARTAADFGKDTSFSDPFVAASLLKLFLRELPDSLFTRNLIGDFEQTVETCKNIAECLGRISDLLNRLPPCNRYVLAYLFLHVHDVIENQQHNKMSLANVGLVLQPALNISQPLLNVFLQNSQLLFAGIQIKRYVSPIKANSSRLSMEFPNNSRDIEEELAKQESLLNYLHEEIKFGAPDPRKEEQLWDVQRLVTQLKRELKKIKKQEDHTSPPLDQQTSTNGGPCVEMFEEKQLLAVQMQLKDRIAAEERAIYDLTRQIGEISSSGNNAGGQPSDDDEDGDVSDDEWYRRYQMQEQYKEKLISKIIEERYNCAHLRAEIEMLTLERRNDIEATRL
jgi:RalA-binding protein 1